MSDMPNDETQPDTPEDNTGKQEGTSRPKAPHEMAATTNLDTPEEKPNPVVEWIRNNRIISAAAVVVVALVAGFGIYSMVGQQKEDVVPQREWAHEVGQQHLPESRVIEGAGKWTISTIDNDQGGKKVDAAVVGIDATGGQTGAELAPPEPVDEVGWYVRSAPFGFNDQGTTVLTSHVDYNGVTGYGSVFSSLREGDPITVTGEDGVEHHYVVTVQPEEILKEDPEYVKKTADTINRMEGPSELILVSCYGNYVGGVLGYDKNIIVRAEPVKALDSVKSFGE